MAPKGKLIAIGGNENKGEEPEAGHHTKVFDHAFIEDGILRRVMDEAGGPGARIAVITPGFAADCLETLEEIAITGEEQFHAAGGKQFTFIPCLNDSEPHLAMLEQLVRRELGGWL